MEIAGISSLRQTDGASSFLAILEVFGKGYLAPLDYLIILGIAVLGIAMGLFFYRMLLRKWIQGLRYPFTLRLLMIGFSVTIIVVALLWFWHFVFQPEPQIRKLLLPTLGVVAAFIVYMFIVSSMAKKPRVS